MIKKLFFGLLFLALAAPCVAPAQMIGVNVSGSEYSWETYPIASHLDYLKNKGVSLIRLPVAWEKFQSTPSGPLNQTEVGKLKSFLQLVASRGMQVILDMHNYGRYNPNWALMG
jgi:endoglucanase